MSWFIITAILSLALTAAVNGGRVKHEWDIVAAPISPDGFTRNAALVNGIFPGPILTANKGDLISVQVNNKLNDPEMRRSTSIVCRLVHLLLRLCVDTAYSTGMEL